MKRIARARSAPPAAHPLNGIEIPPPAAFRADPHTLPERANLLEGGATKQELANDKGWQAYRAAQPEHAASSSSTGTTAVNSEDSQTHPSLAERHPQLGGREEQIGPSPFTPPKILPPGVVPHPKHIPLSPVELTTRRWTSAWAHEMVRSSSLPGMLLMLTLSTANLDVISFQRYGIFTTAQTGNTIILAYHAVERTPGPQLENSGVSLAFYFLSCVVFGQIGWRVGHRMRWWMILSLSWQILLLLILIILVSPSGPDFTRSSGPGDWIAIMLAALQGGPQLTMSSSAGVPEIPTAILTGTYASFAREEDLLHLHPRYRDLKLWYIATFWLGCFIGALVARFSQTWVGFLVAMVCKVMALAWVLWAKGDQKKPPATGKGPAA